MVKKNIVALVQARYNSIRLKGKILKPFNGIPSIELLYKRLKKSKLINRVIIVTSKSSNNIKFINFLKHKKIPFFLGEEENVLKRYYDAAIFYKATDIIRITGDSPLIDPQIADKVINIYLKKKVDYACNTMPPTFPDGLDTEIFSINLLTYAFNKAKTKYDLEHVTPFMRRSKNFLKENVANRIDISNYRWCLDEQDDFKFIDLVYNYFKPNIYFKMNDIVKLIKKNPKKYLMNIKTSRNEGAIMTKTQKLWKRAKQIIPGGNMLLSKRPELFLPNKWPAYYSKAKGYNIWDLDGKKYKDLSLMGIGSNSLGYANLEVDQAVIKSLKNSNMSTLNCPEEVELCEKLLDLHPWAEMAKLARTGGEASAMCIRIARAASGKEKVAFCGYHGWHDWYLSANLKNKDNLQSHLMGGLEANGVPTSLANTAFPFTYNRFDELEKIVSEHDIGTIKMEVSRNFKPKDNFLQKVRQLCDKRNIILIFDECSSGFRQTFGGLHKIYKVNPDIAWFGKTLGNGYAITAIIGKKSVMENAQSTFMSSTFWTERSGPVAALKTLEVMEKIKSWNIITNIGIDVQNNWKKIAENNNLKINILGIPALSSFSLDADNWLKYKTFITQEMLKKGFLATNALFACTKHDEKILRIYYEELNKIFYKINRFENGTGPTVEESLEYDICQTGFQRLN